MKKTTKRILKLKHEGKKISALTAYDYSSAKYFDKAGVDIILVGDSLAQVALGYDNTTQIGMDEMRVFTKAVSKGVQEALVAADMPFLSYQTNETEAIKNAGELIKCGADAVKLEGDSEFIIYIISRLTKAGIPVIGHLGFTPQFVNTIGGHFISGKNVEKTNLLLENAKKLQKAGVFAVVLEMVPWQSAKFITDNLDIPTIGIGAGKFCDGQILVSDDILGKYDRFTPKFARQYSSLKDIIFNCAKAFCHDVQKGNFPSYAESFSLDVQEEQKLYGPNPALLKEQ